MDVDRSTAQVTARPTLGSLRGTAIGEAAIENDRARTTALPPGGINAALGVGEARTGGARGLRRRRSRRVSRDQSAVRIEPSFSLRQTGLIAALSTRGEKTCWLH